MYHFTIYIYICIYIYIDNIYVNDNTHDVSPSVGDLYCSLPLMYGRPYDARHQKCLQPYPKKGKKVKPVHLEIVLFYFAQRTLSLSHTIYIYIYIYINIYIEKLIKP